MTRRLLALPLAACSWLLTPVSDPPSATYPCGHLGVLCSGSFEAHNARCCTADLEECGGPDPTTGFTTCPAGYCCSINGPSTNPNSFGASRKVRPQFTPDGGR